MVANGSTVNIEPHISRAVELQKAVAADETLGVLVRRKALDVIGGAVQDFAKGQIKEAAKQIVELGRDLSPAIMNTAAFAFFKSILGQ